MARIVGVRGRSVRLAVVEIASKRLGFDGGSRQGVVAVGVLGNVVRVML